MLKLRFTYDRRGSDCGCVEAGQACEQGFYEPGGWHWPTIVDCPASTSEPHDPEVVGEHMECRAREALESIRDQGAIDHAQLDAQGENRTRLSLYFSDNQAQWSDPYEEYRAAHAVGDVRILRALCRALKAGV